jgi:Holliday junction resolvase RusA-like endonuclease
LTSRAARDKRKRDITNLLKAPEDLLVKFKVIEADDNTIVQAISARLE